MSTLFGILAGISAFLTALVFALANSFNRDDPATRGIGVGVAYLCTILLAAILLALVIICWSRGALPRGAGLPALLMLAAIIAAMFVSLSILDDDAGVRFQSILPAVAGMAPAIAILYCVWCFYPWARSIVPSSAMQGGVALPVVVLAAIPWLALGPSKAAVSERNRVFEESQQREKVLLAEVDGLPGSASLEVYLPYTDVPVGSGSLVPGRAKYRMARLPGRQEQAEALLNAVDLRMFRLLPDLELQMTPALCEGGRKCARKFIVESAPPRPAPQWDAVEPRFTAPVLAIEWMLDHGCDCKDEVSALAEVVRQYPDSYPRKWFLDGLARHQK